MKPAPFRYFAPETLAEAVSLLAEYGDEAKVLAGGQSLVPLMNFRVAQPSVIIDINRVQGLDHIEVADVVALGATVRQLAAEDSAEIAAAVPLLGEALHYVGHVAIRSRGTIGGSIAHADPAAELPAVLLALGGEARIASTDGERTVRADELFTDMFTTSIGPEELLSGVTLPIVPGHCAVHEVARRRGDFALAGAVVVVTIDAAGAIGEVRMALFGVGATPIRVPAVEEFLVNRDPHDVAGLGEAARMAAASLQLLDDAEVPATYRLSVAEVVTRRALLAATSPEARHD